MAIIKGPIQMTGGISNISFYTRRGSDKIIARTKGGPSKNKIASSPKFEGFRMQQTEWKCCTSFASMLRNSFGGLHRLADYNLTSVLNGFAKNVQKTDEIGENGKRGIYFSKIKYTLDGFNFNRNYPFTNVLRVSSVGEIFRDAMSATVKVPRINTEIDLLNVQRLPYFRLIVTLGAVSDMQWDEVGNAFEAIVPQMHGISEIITGNWIPSESILAEQIIEVQLEEHYRENFTEQVSLVLSMAIKFGKVGFTGATQEVKYAGSGKVLKVG